MSVLTKLCLQLYSTVVRYFRNYSTPYNFFDSSPAGRLDNQIYPFELHASTVVSHV